MIGAKIVIETLIEQGTDVVFGYPGGQVLYIYDELYKNSHRIRHILTAHEQGAAHAADGYARASGKVGVVIATSGPGATNLVTGIANAHLDSSPIVAITGNVPCNLIGRDSFQEVDIAGITMPIVKHNYIVKDITKLADIIREAFVIAKSGRPGPVLIDIPKDIQVGTTEFTNKEPEEIKQTNNFNTEDIEKAIKMINESERPFIYCGGGVVSSGASEETAKLAKIMDAPIGFSMMGLSAISSSDKRNLGMVGMHGRYAAIKAKASADLVLALGVRFSDRATGNKNAYLPSANIIHVDIDIAEIDKNISSKLGIVGNVKDVLKELLSRLEQKKHNQWQEEVGKFKAFEAEHSGKMTDGLSPYEIIGCVGKYASPQTPVVTDVGQHQMWVAQSYKFQMPRTFITSGGLGTMGFGMGGAIGACVASSERTVLFTGDGSFGMNLNEVATAVSQNLPLVIVIMNNGVLGMVRQWQTMFYNKNYSHTTLDRKTDFVKLAEAFGAKGMRATDLKELEGCVKEAFETEGPVIIDCIIDMDERVLPMIPPNGSVQDLIVK